MRFDTEVDRIRTDYARRARLHRHDAARRIVSARRPEIADAGCGGGTWLLEFVRWGADPRLLRGIDRSVERIEDARLWLPESEIKL